MKCPIIETEDQAKAIGEALHEVVHFDRLWSVRVFFGDARYARLTGPGELNQELQSMWEFYWTAEEREQILVAYIKRRLER